MKTHSSKSIHVRGSVVMQLTINIFVKNFNGYGSKTVIILDEGRIGLTSCRFLENTAVNYPYASVITTSRDAVTKFKNCYFENTRTDTNYILLFGQANSRQWFTANNTFNIVASKTGQIIFLHMPSTMKPGVRLNQGSFTILCPKGFVLASEGQRFNVSNKRDCSYLCASAIKEIVLIFRRLILIIVLTFVHDNRPKMIIVLIICVVILIFSYACQTLHYSSWKNFIETLSLGRTLGLRLGQINLLIDCP